MSISKQIEEVFQPSSDSGLNFLKNLGIYEEVMVVYDLIDQFDPNDKQKISTTSFKMLCSINDRLTSLDENEKKSLQDSLGEYFRTALASIGLLYPDHSKEIFTAINSGLRSACYVKGYNPENLLEYLKLDSLIPELRREIKKQQTFSFEIKDQQALTMVAEKCMKSGYVRQCLQFIDFFAHPESPLHWNPTEVKVLVGLIDILISRGIVGCRGRGHWNYLKDHVYDIEGSVLLNRRFKQINSELKEDTQANRKVHDTVKSLMG